MFRCSHCINAQCRMEVHQVIVQSHRNIPGRAVFSPHAITESDLIYESGTSLVKAECF